MTKPHEHRSRFFFVSCLDYRANLSSAEEGNSLAPVPAAVVDYRWTIVYRVPCSVPQNERRRTACTRSRHCRDYGSTPVDNRVTRSMPQDERLRCHHTHTGAVRLSEATLLLTLSDRVAARPPFSITLLDSSQV
ncbi:unnamed protein product [Ectocarpus fasciculatus]